MAVAILKNSFNRNATYTYKQGTDEMSLLGQKVTYREAVNPEEYKTNKYLYIFTYSLMVIVLGCYETFGAAIYTELSRQLDVGTDVIAFIFTCKSISFAISAILCAYITDYFHETHRYISLTMFFSSVALIIIPHIHNTYTMYVLFAIIGYSLGSIYVCFPVYIFRLYPTKQSLMIYILLSIYGMTKVLLPLIIELFIRLTEEYDLSLYMISVIGFLDCICLLFLVTPEHDSLRTIKADMKHNREKAKSADHLDVSNGHNSDNAYHSNTEVGTSFGNISDDHTVTGDTNNISHHFEQNLSNTHRDSVCDESNTEIMLESQTELEDISNQIKFVLRNNKRHVVYEWIVIILLSINMALFSANQSGLTYFITTYCDEYLDINESNGRFMISCYFLGQFTYRLIFAVFIGDKYSKKFSPQKMTMFAYIIMTFCSLILAVWPKDITVLYFVFIVCGTFGGGIFPDIYKWSETMKPVSGVLSCFYIIGFAFGDAMIILIIGELFAEIGAHTLPYPILITNFTGSLFTVLTIGVYSRYQKNKSSILSTFYHGN